MAYDPQRSRTRPQLAEEEPAPVEALLEATRPESAPGVGDDTTTERPTPDHVSAVAPDAAEAALVREAGRELAAELEQPKSSGLRSKLLVGAAVVVAAILAWRVLQGRRTEEG